MRKYFLAYLTYLEDALQNTQTDWQRLMKLHLQKIQFFQHERLVHLLVLILVALCTLASFLTIVVTESVSLIPLALVLLVLLGFYIRHYYFLENNTQKLYVFYDRIEEKCAQNMLEKR